MKSKWDCVVNAYEHVGSLGRSLGSLPTEAILDLQEVVI